MVRGFSDVEQIHRWTKAGMTPNAIAELQGRDPGTVAEFLPAAADGKQPQKTIALNPDCQARLLKINQSQSLGLSLIHI